MLKLHQLATTRQFKQNERKSKQQVNTKKK